MNLCFYCWLIMTACSVALLIVNRKKQKIIEKYRAIMNEYLDDDKETVVMLKEGINHDKEYIAKLKEDINHDKEYIAKLKESLESADKLIKEQQELISRLRHRFYKNLDEIDNLKKQAAEYTPMKSMADYTEKITKFSEQAEDMFRLHIDTIHLERYGSIYKRYWKINVMTSGEVKGSGCDGIATDGKGCCDTATDGTDGTGGNG